MNKTSLKIATALLSVIFVLSVFPNVRVNSWDAGDDGTCGDNLTWHFNGITLFIDGTGDMDPINTFRSNDDIKEVIIGSGVTSIAEWAFQDCSLLLNVVIPDSVTSIGDDAFWGCNSLTSVTIPDSVTSIGARAFFGCSDLTSITIPNSVTSIGDGAFRWCNDLESITIPESVTSIGESAFEGCRSLTSVTIPESVTSIGESAFKGCSSLTSVTIPESVTSIGASAFEGCSSLTSVDIPQGVTSIGESSFYGCSSLTSVTIPESVTSIGNGAFGSCDSLTSITIPDSVTSIGRCAFANCTSLDCITIPDSVTMIDDCAFMECSSLTSVTVLSDATSFIGNDIFNGCSNLESVEIDKALYDKLDADVFGNCPKFDESKCVFRYKVTFVNDDGTELYSNSLKYGATPSYPYSTPEKQEDARGTYTFSGWSDGSTTYGTYNALPVLTADTTYTAQYYESLKKYTVTFNNYDGTELSSTQYEYGTEAEAITIPSTTPSRDADEQYTYTFIGWDKEIADVKGDATYTASYSTTTNQYNVVFKDYNGNVLSSTAYDYDTKAEDIKVPTPSRAADTQYTYTFTGWDKEIANVTVDVIYTAQYSSTVNKYTVKFVDDEGNVLQSSDVAYGTAPEFNGATPSKADTDKATYTFSGWTDGTNTYGSTDKLPAITGEVTYKVMFAETLKPVEAETTIVKPVETPIEVAQPAPITYTIGEVKGDGINSDIVIDVHRSEDDANCISYFRSVANNGVAMKNGEQYTAVTGSTIITIKSDYIKTLPAGEYTITVNFKDGSISTTITIPERSGTSVPSTGESISPAIYVGVALILVSCAATGIILNKKRREEV